MHGNTLPGKEDINIYDSLDERSAVRNFHGKTLEEIYARLFGEYESLQEDLAFMGPLKEVKPWQTKGVEGISRFLARVWRLAMVENQEGEWVQGSKITGEDTGAVTPVRKEVHKTIKKVTEDIEAMSFTPAFPR